MQKIKVLILSILVICICTTFYLLYMIYTPVDIHDDKKIKFIIKKGQTATEISNNLYKQNIINSNFIFKWYIKIFDYDKKFNAGEFILSKNMDYPSIIDKLSKAEITEIKITFPEGLNIKQIAQLGDKKGYFTYDEFMQCINECVFEYDFLENGKVKEGYLFPDTYILNVINLEPKIIIEKMLNNFLNKISKLNIKSGAIVFGKKRSLEEIVIMASMIEEESTNNDEERRMIAGILWKRLDEKMVLGVDATNRYILNKITGDLTYDDFQIKSKYNTRKYLGLPPTAISNPGYASLYAAINPIKSEYYYYLHDDKGNIHYSKTLEEHDIKRKKYIK